MNDYSSLFVANYHDPNSML